MQAAQSGIWAAPVAQGSFAELFLAAVPLFDIMPPMSMPSVWRCAAPASA